MLFRNRLIEETKPPPSPELVAQLEDLLGCELPADYRHFIECCNGGYSEFEIDLNFNDGTSLPVSFSTLFSLTAEDTRNTLRFELTEARRWLGFPRKFLPIAQADRGSTLYLDLRTGYRVVVQVIGLPVIIAECHGTMLVEVATTFNEYLDSLYISDQTILGAIRAFDPFIDDPKAMAKWFDAGSPNWRTTHAESWDYFVVRRHGG